MEDLVKWPVFIEGETADPGVVLQSQLKKDYRHTLSNGEQLEVEIIARISNRSPQDTTELLRTFAAISHKFYLDMGNWVNQK